MQTCEIKYYFLLTNIFIHISNLHTAHFTLHTSHCIQHTATLHTAHCTLHTAPVIEIDVSIVCSTQKFLAVCAEGHTEDAELGEQELSFVCLKMQNWGGRRYRLFMNLKEKLFFLLHSWSNLDH